MLRVIEYFALSLKVIQNSTTTYEFLFSFRMALSCIITEIKRDIHRKCRFFKPPCIRRTR